jgi:hypothetical protein
MRRPSPGGAAHPTGDGPVRARRSPRSRPPAWDPRVGKESAEGLPYLPEQPVDCGGGRSEPEVAQHPGQPTCGGEVFEQANGCGAVHQPHARRLDELPRLGDLVARDARGVGCRRLIIAAQEGESLAAIQPGDEPRRRATERSASVEQQKRPARRRDILEPRRIEHEAILASHRRRSGVGRGQHGGVLEHLVRADATATQLTELLRPPECDRPARLHGDRWGWKRGLGPASACPDSRRRLLPFISWLVSEACELASECGLTRPAPCCAPPPL